MAGYSKRSLVEKLGIKSGHTVYLSNAPQDYRETLGVLPEKVVLMKSPAGACDFIQFFTKDKSELEVTFPNLRNIWRRTALFGFHGPKERQRSRAT